MTADFRADIVYAIDENYVLPLSVSLSSVQESASRNVTAVVLCDHVTEASKQWILASVPRPQLVEFVDIDGHDLPNPASHGLTATLSRVIFARLMIPKSIVDPQRFIYLDADTVVSADIHILLSFDLSGVILRAVRDDTYTLFVRKTARIPVDSCFNSGVLLMNSARWFDDAIGKRALGQVIERQVNDQGALNVACAGAWAELPPEWNVTTQDILLKRRGGSPLLEPHIRHLTAVKPWRREAQPGDIDRLQLRKYYEVFDRTVWRRG